MIFFEYNVKILCLQAPARTSNLFAPIMVCEGHEGEIFTVDFHPEGQYFATSGFDRKICKYLCSWFMWRLLTSNHWVF